MFYVSWAQPLILFAAPRTHGTISFGSSFFSWFLKFAQIISDIFFLVKVTVLFIFICNIWNFLDFFEYVVHFQQELRITRIKCDLLNIWLVLKCLVINFSLYYYVIRTCLIYYLTMSHIAPTLISYKLPSTTRVYWVFKPL